MRGPFGTDWFSSFLEKNEQVTGSHLTSRPELQCGQECRRG